MPGKTRRKLVTSKSDDNEIFREGLMFASHRLKTFKRWRFNKKGVCTAEALANAGFVHTGKDSAKCVYCGKEMLWDCDDDPFIEHKSHSPKCIFVIMNQPSEDEMTLAQFVKLREQMFLECCHSLIREFVEKVETAHLNSIEKMWKKLNEED